MDHDDDMRSPRRGDHAFLGVRGDGAGRPADWTPAHLTPIPTSAGERDAGRETTVRRTVRFPAGRRETPILRRESLGPGSTLAGPAIIEQLDTTTVLPPGFRAAVDAAGNLIIDVPGISAA